MRRVFDGLHVAHPSALVSLSVGKTTRAGIARPLFSFSPTAVAGRSEEGRQIAPLLVDAGPGMFILKLELRVIDGENYLFIESGGFSPRNPPGWTTPWLVLTRKN